MQYTASQIDAAAIPQGSTTDDELAAQIDAQLVQGFRWLRFAPAIERRFIADTEVPRRRHHLVMLLIALTLFDLFLIGDRQLIPDIFTYAAWVRLGVMTPVALFSALMIRYGISHSARELIITMSCVSSGVVLILFMLKTESPFASHYYMGVPLTIIYCNTVQRVRFWYAVGGSVVTLLFTVVGLGNVDFLRPEVKQTFDMLLLSMCVFTLIALYRLEYEERANYLFRLRDRLSQARERRLVDDLSDANRQLEHLSRCDPLTGIANRRHFQEHVAEVWDKALQSGAPLSLLVLDVDYFKQYNDRYGHPAGDQCLIRVASAAKAALRLPGDFAARYGGEEFVAVLPNTSMPQALGIAERVRRSVLGIDLLHETSAVAGVVTVSVGAASTVPSRAGGSPDDLLKAADLALYRAKSSGRNRVWPVE